MRKIFGLSLVAILLLGCAEQLKDQSYNLNNNRDSISSEVPPEEPPPPPPPPPPSEPPWVSTIVWPVTVITQGDFWGTYNSQDEFDFRVKNLGYERACINIDNIRAYGPINFPPCINLTSSNAQPPPPPPPETCAGPQPSNENQILNCPVGQVGSIIQTRTYSCVGTNWVPGNWAEVSNTCAAPIVPGTCPASPWSTNIKNLEWGYVMQLRMRSEEIGVFPIKPREDGRSSILLTQGQQPSTAANTITEMSVSKCPGVIDTSVSQCYFKTSSVSYNAATVYTKPTMGWVDQETLGDRGCWAPESEGQWYVNVRWTYPHCPFYECGFSMQWSLGGY